MHASMGARVHIHIVSAYSMHVSMAMQGNPGIPFYFTPQRTMIQMQYLCLHGSRKDHDVIFSHWVRK